MASTSGGLGRSLTLLRVFLLASAAIVVTGALVLCSVLTDTLTRQAVNDEGDDITLYANAVLSPLLVKGDRVVVDIRSLARLGEQVRMPHNVRSVSIWSRDGRLLFSTLAPERIGRHSPLGPDLKRVLATGEPLGRIEETSPEARASLGEAGLGLHRVLQAYAPIYNRDDRVVGAYEVSVDPSAIDAVITKGKRRIWVAIIAVFTALYVAIALLVRGASRRLRQQNQELRDRSDELLESYRRLEQSGLETIEALNATVEAKDPYTAGHSERVRRIALEIGRELRLPHGRMEMLGISALFHDVGKLAIPDGILTKPGRLDEQEYDLVKLHPEKGAEILGRLSHLAATVPAILHHHERWDGQGYPAALAGSDIPPEAAIVGLADAWDAMTTDRPYAAALSFERALREVRDGRGTQFSPVVVDAFLRVALRAHPELARATPQPIAATAALTL